MASPQTVASIFSRHNPFHMRARLQPCPQTPKEPAASAAEVSFTPTTVGSAFRRTFCYRGIAELLTHLLSPFRWKRATSSPRRASAIKWALAPAFLVPTVANAQATYAGTAPGSYIALGLTGAAFRSDYGHTPLAGGTVYLDTNLYRRIGAEFQYRVLRPLPGHETVHQDTFLFGPKISTHARKWRPYGKLLAGRGHFTFPFHDAQGSYFVLAPGAGLDFRPPTGDSDRPSRWLFRIADVEYQFWPSFTFGPLHPYGLTTGLSYSLY